jgi:hypothetical protein
VTFPDTRFTALAGAVIRRLVAAADLVAAPTTPARGPQP